MEQHEIIEKHNNDTLELCKTELNNSEHRAVFVMGTKPGKQPKFISFSFLEEPEIAKFLRMTADLIDNKQMSVTYIDLTEQKND